MLNIYRIIFVFLTIQILFNQTVFAEVYKWTDEDGNIIYGDRPGSDNADKLQIKKRPVQDIEARKRLQKQEKLLDVMQQERTDKVAQEKKAREEKEMLNKKCVQARKKLQEIRDARALYQESDDPKNPIILTAEERARYEEELQKQIDRNCN